MSDLYSLESEFKDGPATVFVVRINENHPVFDDHFPGHPIVPGVMLFIMIRELVQQLHGCQLRLVEVHNAKFLIPLMSEKDLLLNVHVSPVADEKLKCHAEIRRNGSVCFKGLFNWEQRD